jgi:hypothetical protein
MKWFYAGLALALFGLAFGITAIIVGYRQMIGRYIRETPRSGTDITLEPAGPLKPRGKA